MKLFFKEQYIIFKNTNINNYILNKINEFVFLLNEIKLIFEEIYQKSFNLSWNSIKKYLNTEFNASKKENKITLNEVLTDIKFFFEKKMKNLQEWDKYLEDLMNDNIK